MAVLRWSQPFVNHFLGAVFYRTSSAIVFPEVCPMPGALTALHWQMCSAC